MTPTHIYISLSSLLHAALQLSASTPTDQARTVSDATLLQPFGCLVTAFQPYLHIRMNIFHAVVQKKQFCLRLVNNFALSYIADK